MHTQAQIRDSYRKLPDDLREIIGSPELSIVTDKISELFGLNETQQKSLRDIVCFILIGIEPKSLLKETIVKNLSINEEKSIKICEKINNEILDNLDHIHSLVVYDENESEEKISFQVDTPEAQRKIKEIEQKYSLSADQVQKLEYSLRIGTIYNLAEEMQVSEILADQIKSELANKISKSSRQGDATEKVGTNKNQTTTLEIAPDILPVVETRRMEEERRNAMEKVKIPVPRYIVPDNLPGAQTIEPEVPNSVYTAPNQSSSTPKPTAEIMPNTQTIPPKTNYQSDPYREPLE